MLNLLELDKLVDALLEDDRVADCALGALLLCPDNIALKSPFVLI
jgi:hypothetical protein